MVEAKSRLFQMQQKGVFGHALELLKTGFGEAPKGFNAVEVPSATHEFILAVTDTGMAVEAHVHQPVVAAPAVGVDYGSRVDFAAYNGLQDLFRAVGDDFGVHLPAAFEQAKDNSFAARASAPFAPHSPRAEVTFVEFNGSAQLGRHRAPGLQAPAQTQLQSVDRTHTQAREPGRVRGRQI